MAADATAAGVYQSGVARGSDPIGSYMMGVKLKSALQAQAAAEAAQTQAQTFGLTMNLMKMADARADREQRAKLADREMEIATYNAETNRINANRPRTGTGTGAVVGGATSGPQIIHYPDGSIDVIMPGEQGPTSGEGDTTVAPLSESGEIGVLPGGAAMQSQTGFAPLPGMGAPSVPPQTQSAVGSHIPGIANPFGGGEPEKQPPPSAMGLPAAPPQKRGQFEIDSYNPKTGNMNLKRISAGNAQDAPVIPAPPEVLEKYSALYDGFGKVAVPTNDKAYPQGFKLEDKPTLHGKSIADLSADEQKRFGDLAQEVLTMTGEMKIATPEAKMAAVGITDPAQMTDELWKKGYQIVQADPNSPGDPKQGALLIQKATQLAAFKNTMLDTNVHGPEMILSQMGVDTKGMMPQAQQQPAGREVAVSGMGQATRSGAPEPAPAAPQQPGKFMQPDSAPVGAKAKPEAIADDPTLSREERQRRVVAREAAAKTAQPISSRERARQEASAKWEENKKKIDDLAVGTVNLEDFSRSDDSPVPGPGSGMIPNASGKYPQSIEQKWGKWLEKNRDKLKIKTLDNKPLTLDSPVFINEEGRTVDMKEIMRAYVDDERTKTAITSANGLQKTAKSFTPKAESVLQQAGLAN